MIIKTTVTALALILIPAMSMAYSCSARGNQAQSCAPGTIWNVAQQNCVEQVNG